MTSDMLSSFVHWVAFVKCNHSSAVTIQLACDQHDHKINISHREFKMNVLLVRINIILITTYPLSGNLELTALAQVLSAKKPPMTKELLYSFYSNG